MGNYRSKIRRLQKSDVVPVSCINTCELEICARTYLNLLLIYTARNEYATDVDFQNFERKANDKLQSCIIQKSNLRVLEKIGQGNFFRNS